MNITRKKEGRKSQDVHTIKGVSSFNRRFKTPALQNINRVWGNGQVKTGLVEHPLIQFRGKETYERIGNTSMCKGRSDMQVNGKV